SSVETVEYLLERAANIRLRSSEGKNALERAAGNVGPNGSSKETVKCLVAGGCTFDPSKYKGTDAKTTAYLEKYPIRHMQAVCRVLRKELAEIACEKESEEVRSKTDLEAGGDVPLDDLLMLPYHRVPEGMAEF